MNEFAPIPPLMLRPSIDLIERQSIPSDVPAETSPSRAAAEMFRELAHRVRDNLAALEGRPVH